MASKKGAGSTQNNRDSRPKYRGVKLFGGQQVRAGQIIVVQCGLKYRPGLNVYASRTHFLHAAKDGHVMFKVLGKNQRMTVSVVE